MSSLKQVYRKATGLRWKLFYSYLALSIIPLLFYANTIMNTMDSAYTQEKRSELLSYANRVAAYITNENFLGDTQKGIMFDAYIDSERKQSSNRIIVVNTAGVILNDSSTPNSRWWAEKGQILHSPDILKALDRTSSWSIQGNRDLMNLAVFIAENAQSSTDIAAGTPGTAGVAGAVMVISSIDDKNELMSSMNQRLILLTVLLILIILILVFYISQLIIEPLKNILAAVKRIASGHLNQRVKFFGYDEFADLGGAFNDMTDKLEKVEEARSEFVSNVSHELKTPLSSIKVLSESLLLQDDADIGLYKEFFGDINSEVDRMTKIINDLLALVLLDRTEQSLSISTCKLNNMLEDIIKRLRPLADQKDIEVYFSDPAPVSVEGDEMKLELALTNVIENAIKYTNTGGGVTVDLESDAQNAVITIKDTGIGISETEVSRIFDRFYRVDKT
ncbi:MAG: HAMP domain-containing histidine kinase, partial [Clostridiales bacterium]|nr:HAMP domain-containing histidine kinase [Clostridiales bacterium]